MCEVVRFRVQKISDANRTSSLLVAIVLAVSWMALRTKTREECQMSEPQILSLDEAAAALKVGVPTLEELIARGLLQTVRERDEIRVRYDDLVAFLRDSQRANVEDGEPPAARLEADLS